MSWVVKVYGPGATQHGPFGPLDHDRYAIDDPKDVRRNKHGLLKIRTKAYVATIRDVERTFPSTVVYYLPGQVHKYVVYKKPRPT